MELGLLLDLVGLLFEQELFLVELQAFVQVQQLVWLELLERSLVLPSFEASSLASFVASSFEASLTSFEALHIVTL